jgi:bacteroidetes-specific putative membrane protein
MKRIVLFILAVFACGTKAFSQELTLPQQNQYLADSEFLIAPTYAGIGDFVRLRLSGVTQWVGVKGAPDYQSLAGDMRLGERSGAGLMLYNDRNGHTTQMGGKATFAHHLTVDRYDNHFISFGISYALNTFKIDIDKFNRAIPDQAVTNDRFTVNHNFDVAVLYRYKGWFMNLSALNILNKDIERFYKEEPKALRNYLVYAGYRYKKDKRSNFEIEPSLLYQYYESDGRSTTDFNIKFRWMDMQDYYWVGANYRSLNDQILRPLNIGPMAGLKRGMLYFAYSYQLTLNEIIGYNSGTHMIALGLDLFQGVSNCKCAQR